MPRDEVVAWFEELARPLPVRYGARVVAIERVFAVTHAGQPRLPARRVEGEGIPAMIAPSLPRMVRLFQNHMVHRPFCQIVAYAKASLSSAHDDGVYYFAHRPSPDAPAAALRRRQFACRGRELGLMTGCNKPPNRHMIDNEM
jgi:hypothetical protein